VTNAEAWFNKSLRPRKPEGSLGRTAQDVHLDSHTAPELWRSWPSAQVLTLCEIIGAIKLPPNQKTKRTIKKSLSRFGLAVRRQAVKRKDLGSIPLRLSFFFRKVVVCGHSLVVTLSLTINETLKWLSSMPILMQEPLWWWQCSDRYILSLFPHLHIPSPFFPSLISLMVSVAVKHCVYQRASTRKATDLLRSFQSRYHVTFLSCLTVRRFPKLQ